MGAHGAVSCDAVGEVRELLFFPLRNENPSEAGQHHGYGGLGTCALVTRGTSRRHSQHFVPSAAHVPI